MNINIDGKLYGGNWLHGTYNSTLWLGKDEDGDEVYDLYYPTDQSALGLVARPVKISTEGNLLLHFYHGRESVDTEMNDWGSTGPTIEICKIELTDESIKWTTPRGRVEERKYIEGLILYGGVYYGDIDISADRYHG